jgi:CHASE1-domain containing sensor protein
MAKMRERRPVRLWQVAAVAILVFGTAGITLGTLAWYSTNKHDNRAEVQANADQVANTTRKTLAGYNDQIANAVALFKQSGLINRAEFSAYVKNLDRTTATRGSTASASSLGFPQPNCPRSSPSGESTSRDSPCCRRGPARRTAW